MYVICMLYVHLVIKEDTKDMLLNECVKEFHKSNPDMIGVNITHDFILRRVIKYYLDK